MPETVQRRLRKTVRRIARLDVQPVNSMTMPFNRLVETLRARAVRTVIDVGANDGGFASELFDAGYTGKIISFEPLPDVWERLRQRATGFGPHWIVAPCLALSDYSGAAAFHVSGNRVSSSLLPILSRTEKANPATRTVETISVNTARLDDVLAPLGAEGPLFLKLDVQGAERAVLAGAERILRDETIGMHVELSLVPLYDGQALADDLIQFLAAQGFHLWDIVPGFRDPYTFQLLQYDGIFYR